MAAGDNETDRDRLLTELHRTLLAHGGATVERTEPDGPHDDIILERGQLFRLPVKERRGRPGQRHSNTAAVWARSIKKYRLVVGYALKDGVWRPHSWVVDEKWLYDTAAPATQYFGAEMSDDEAIEFWFTHYLPERYPRARVAHHGHGGGAGAGSNC